jgi:hypothetical protein
MDFMDSKKDQCNTMTKQRDSSGRFAIAPPSFKPGSTISKHKNKREEYFGGSMNTLTRETEKHLPHQSTGESINLSTKLLAGIYPKARRANFPKHPCCAREIKKRIMTNSGSPAQANIKFSNMPTALSPPVLTRFHPGRQSGGPPPTGDKIIPQNQNSLEIMNPLIKYELLLYLNRFRRTFEHIIIIKSIFTTHELFLFTE